MTGQRKTHPEEEILERFAMKRLDEPQLAEFEEHLLLCEHCQNRLDEVTEYAAVAREAAENVATAPVKETSRRKWGSLDWLPMPAPALAAAFIVLIAILVWQPWRVTAPGEWRTVELATLRGAREASTAAAGFSLHLRLDVSGLDAGGASAAIVNASGAVLAETPVSLVDGKAELNYAAGLAAGQYWVRLKKAGETVREYSLAVNSR